MAAQTYTLIIHYKLKQFTYTFTSDINEWDNEQYLNLLAKIGEEFNFINEPLHYFGLYEDIEGERIDIDDMDDLIDAFQDDDDDMEIKTKSLLHIYVKDNEQIMRLLWQKDNYLSIFSRSKNKWYDGKIENIYGEHSDEWLVVRYDKNKTKEIQRNSKDIKPLQRNHRLLWNKNTECTIFSDISNRWCKGIIIDIFNDSEGEWLKVKYNEMNSIQTQITEIQRFSKDIKPISYYYSNIIENENKENINIYQNIEIDEFYIKYLVYGYMRNIAHTIVTNIPSVIFMTCLSYSRPCSMYIQPNIGDRIILKDDKRGVVRYINEELIGIELDEWCPNSNKSELFSAASGHSYFINRKCKGYMYSNSVMEGGYAILNGLIKAPVYNGKMVKIIAWIQKTGRWKVKLVYFAQQFKKYLGVTLQHLKPLKVWRELNYKIDKSLERKLKNGYLIKNDYVLCINEKYGEIMYIDESLDSPNRPSIGIKLEAYDINSGNGIDTMIDKLRFNVEKGYGYFTTYSHIIASFTNNTYKYNNDMNIYIGDYVQFTMDGNTLKNGLITFKKNNIVIIEYEYKNNYNQKEIIKQQREYITSIKSIKNIIYAIFDKKDLNKLTEKLNKLRTK